MYVTYLNDLFSQICKKTFPHIEIAWFQKKAIIINKKIGQGINLPQYVKYNQ